MKILFTETNDYKIDGIYAAISSVEDNCHIWKPAHTSLYNAAAELKPDLIFLTKEYFGVFQLAPPDPNIPIVLLNYNNTVNPQIKLCYTIPEYADTVRITGGSFQEKLAADCVCLARNLSLEIAGLFSSMGIRIFGAQRLPVESYLGMVTHKMMSDIIKSSKIVLCIDGHYLYDVAANGGFALSNKQYTYDFPLFTIDELPELIPYYVNKPKIRKKIAKTNQTGVLSNNTSYCIISDIFKKLNINDYEDKICQLQK